MAPSRAFQGATRQGRRGRSPRRDRCRSIADVARGYSRIAVDPGERSALHAARSGVRSVAAQHIDHQPAVRIVSNWIHVFWTRGASVRAGFLPATDPATRRAGRGPGGTFVVRSARVVVPGSRSLSRRTAAPHRHRAACQCRANWPTAATVPRPRQRAPAPVGTR